MLSSYPVFKFDTLLYPRLEFLAVSFLIASFFAGLLDLPVDHPVTWIAIIGVALVGMAPAFRFWAHPLGFQVWKYLSAAGVLVVTSHVILADFSSSLVKFPLGLLAGAAVYGLHSAARRAADEFHLL